MLCRKCGADIPEGTRFCSKCGASVSADNNQGSKRANNIDLKAFITGENRKYAIITGIVLGVLVVAVTLFTILVLPNMAINAFKEQIQDREYREAYLAYEEFDSEDRTRANKWMREYIGEVETDYYEGKLDYSTATGILEEMMQFDAAYNEASKAEENVYLDNQSSAAFDKAKEYAEAQKWEDAYMELQNVHIKYRLYDDVAALREECVTNYRTRIVEQVNAYASNGEIDKLIAARDDALMILPDDKEIIQACQTHLNDYVAKTLADAATLAESNDYAGAMELLQYASDMYDNQDFEDAMENYRYDSAVAHCEALAAQNDLLGAVEYANDLADEDSQYSDLLSKYADALVENTLATAQSYADKRAFQDAIDSIEAVQEVYDCSELRNAVDEYSACLPVKLTECYVVDDSDGWLGSDLDVGDWTDSFGNEHMDSLMIECGTYPEYIIYNLDAKYATMDGTITYTAASYLTEALTIKIYLDDELVYTSPSITKTLQPTNIKIDVSGAILLRIECEETEDRSFDSGACIIDAMLS